MKYKIKMILESVASKISTVGFQRSLVNYPIIFECYAGIA